MTTELLSFDFEGAGLRGLRIDGEPWFIAKDVADVLGYAATATAIKAHCKCYRPVGGGRFTHP